MTALDFHARLGRLIEEGFLDKDADVFAMSPGGNLSPIIAIDPVNQDIGKVILIPSMAITFGRLR